MATATETGVRLEVGLDGGQIVQFVSGRDKWDELRSQVENTDSRWVTIQADDDAEYVLLVEKIAYVRVVAHKRGIGFRD